MISLVDQRLNARISGTACGSAAATGWVSVVILLACLLDLLLAQCEKTLIVDLDDLPADARQVAHRAALTTSDGLDDDLVVLIDELLRAVAGHECRDLLAVLDQLHAAALAHGRIRLLC